MRAVIAWFLLCICWPSAAGAPMPVTIALPGPGTLPYLPIDLMPKIGADKSEGVQVTLRHFGGGPLVIKDMMSGNSDFAALGFSALAETAGIEGKAYALASLVQVPAYTLMVSSRMKSKVKSPADLRGRSIGVHSGSKGGKSTGQHITEFLLGRAGVSPQDVNFISAGQNYKAYSAALLSGAADAIITNEPSATRLEAAGIAYRLVDLHDPTATRKYFGSLFQYTQLCARTDVIQHQTDKVNRVMAALISSLKWIQKHNAREVAERMGIQDQEERDTFIRALEKHRAMFSPDGVFSAEALAGTAALIKAVHEGEHEGPGLERLINDQWVGSRQ
ncbi:MAG: ABC transporter substrate-binding protein [Thiobacillus sp.]|nr:ABC transporter substrate-binding protein [Thiobacillus sp.]